MKPDGYLDKKRPQMLLPRCCHDLEPLFESILQTLK